MGLSITTPVAAATGCGAGSVRGAAGVRGGRRGRGGRHQRGGRRRFGSPPPEPDLGLALDEINRRQVVPLHQPDEMSDRAYVEGLVGFLRVIRHTCKTPDDAERRSGRGQQRAPRSAQAIRTESSDFGTCERTSQPSGVTSTSSSIRIPPQSGR